MAPDACFAHRWARLAVTTKVAARVAELAARDRFGRLVGYLAQRFGTLSEAEDALSQALLSALEQWPVEGIPNNPSAWLLTVARRRITDAMRRNRTRDQAQAHLETLAEERADLVVEAPDFPDDRLKLMVACTHPAIARSVQAPLILQVVLGFDAQTISSVFLVSPTAMGQRLARAKRKIRASGIRVDVDGVDLSEERAAGVLDAIYTCFTAGWIDGGTKWRSEAQWLGRLVCRARPDDAEALGLAALMRFIDARRDARLVEGHYIPLDAQDSRAWYHDEIDEADLLLARASRLKRPGRFQIEAAIQSVHGARRRTGRTDWAAIGRLYDALMQVAPSVGGAVSRSAAWLMAGHRDAAQAQLDALEPQDVKAYQPYWAVAAEVAKRSGDQARAQACYDRAIGLSVDPAERAYLVSQQKKM
ncbi:MAG: DUF6596 domain-containing protein [Myxococcota bacterium]